MNKSSLVMVRKKTPGTKILEALCKMSVPDMNPRPTIQSRQRCDFAKALIFSGYIDDVRTIMVLETNSSGHDPEAKGKHRAFTTSGKGRSTVFGG